MKDFIMRLFTKMLLAFSWLLLANTATFAATVTSGAAAAHTPRVVVSIKPLHAWVSAVMHGVGVPDLLLKNSDSVHNYQLKPSDASALSKADIIFITDKKMEVYLKKSMGSLSAKARLIALDSAPSIKLLPIRTSGAHKHRSAIKSETKVGSHPKATKYNFHFWLDPQNAIAATIYIAETLSAVDPDHASLYKANASQYVARLQQLISKTQSRLKGHEDIKFIVFHDAYYYYEKRFGLQAVGAITLNPEHQPGARKIKIIRNKIKKDSVTCVYTEPQFSPAIVNNIIEGTSSKQGVLDPIGAALKPGADSYLMLIDQITDSLLSCSGKR